MSYLEQHTPPVLHQVLTSVGSHCPVYKDAKYAHSSLWVVFLRERKKDQVVFFTDTS